MNLPHVLSRSWSILALRGAFALLLGFTVLLWPTMSLAALVLVFGIYVLLDAIAAVAIGARHGEREHAWLWLLEGGAGVGLGLAALAWTRTAVELIVLAIGLWAIATGALEAAIASRLRRELPSEGLLLAAGVASMLLGVAVFIVPTTSAVGLTLLFGVYGVVFGAALLGQAVRLRRQLRRFESGDGPLGSRPREA
jgi:uncharacterized membrane protein HdeD (DUF308 family)